MKTQIEFALGLNAICSECRKNVEIEVTRSYVYGGSPVIRFLVEPCSCISESEFDRGCEEGYAYGRQDSKEDSEDCRDLEDSHAAAEEKVDRLMDEAASHE